MPARKSPATPATNPGAEAVTPASASAKAPTVAKAVKQALATKPVPAEPVKAAKPKAAKPSKPAKPAKLRQKPVRDSFTMPEADFALIATLKARALAAQRETKKSELLRAGLHALAALDSKALVAALGLLDPVKIGRPKKGH